MLVTKDISNNVFENIYPWGETLTYIAWVIRASFHCILKYSTGQSVRVFTSRFPTIEFIA